MFEGDGFVSLGYTGTFSKSIKFLILTKQTEAFVMNIGHFKFLISNGKLIVKFNDENSKIESNIKINTNKFYLVELLMEKDKYTLLIDGNYDDNGQLITTSNINHDGVITLGKDEDDGSMPGFKGEISDIFIDDK